MTFTWFNNRVEDFEDLDEAMGLDDGENVRADLKSSHLETSRVRHLYGLCYCWGAWGLC